MPCVNSPHAAASRTARTAATSLAVAISPNMIDQGQFPIFAGCTGGAAHSVRWPCLQAVKVACAMHGIVVITIRISVYCQGVVFGACDRSRTGVAVVCHSPSISYQYDTEGHQSYESLSCMSDAQSAAGKLDYRTHDRSRIRFTDMASIFRWIQ